MEDLIRKACGIWKAEWQGIFIGRIYYLRSKRGRRKIGPEEVSIETKENRIVTITCRKESEGQIVEELKTVMIYPVMRREHRKKTVPSTGSIWRNFSKGEIWSFSRKTEDHNPIHLNEKPVVQGFLLLEHIVATFPNKEEYQISFHSPVLADENIYLQIQGESFSGYGKRDLYFTGTAEKRRNEE